MRECGGADYKPAGSPPYQMAVNTGSRSHPMLRLVVIALFVTLIWVLVLKLFDRKRPLDWNGIAFAVGFIALAFYLRHVTGMG
jgi:hypothetical protein